jgi:hypothetical protein
LEDETPPNSNVLFPVVFENEASTPLRHIFQQLDVSLFGVLKRRGHYRLPFDDDQGTTNFLFKVYWTFKQAVVKANIWGFSGSCVWT